MDYPEEDPANEAPISRSKSTLQRDAKVSNDDDDDNDSIDDIDDQVAKKSSKNNKRKDFLMREQFDYFEKFPLRNRVRLRRQQRSVFR